MYTYRNLNAHIYTQVPFVFITDNSSTIAIQALTEILLYAKDELGHSKY